MYSIDRRAGGDVAEAAILGALVGLGALIALFGTRGRQIFFQRTKRTLIDLRRIVAAAVAGLVAASGTLLATGWPVLAGALGLLSGWVIACWRRRGSAQRELVRIEAIAVWAEQLRDVLNGSSGLHSALVVTSRLAPEAIKRESASLAARLEYERTSTALRSFADDLHHPVGDFVVAALIIAADHQARDLSGLLGRLAATARDEARVRSKVWVSRARLRASVRVISAVIPVMFGAVMVVDREYLDPYNAPAGQVVLGVVLLIFALAFGLLSRGSRIQLPDRLFENAQSTVSV